MFTVFLGLFLSLSENAGYANVRTTFKSLKEQGVPIHKKYMLGRMNNNYKSTQCPCLLCLLILENGCLVGQAFIFERMFYHCIQDSRYVGLL
jgi:hypothetical protein